MGKKYLCLGIVLALILGLVAGGCSGAADGPYELSGLVTDKDGQGVAGVTISFSSGDEVITGSDGYWSKEDLTGKVTVTPSKGSWSFTPTKKTVNKAASNVDFTGTSETGQPGKTAGERSTHNLESIAFHMRLVPGGLTFPMGIDDSGSGKVEDAYWVAETPVTYELWHAVYTWATHEERGDKQYVFQFPGREGSKGTDGAEPTGDKNHPVTMISGRDAKVWSNALTEYYNFKNGTNLDCVYIYNGEVARDSAQDGHSAEIKAGAKGFRLLTIKEWELAARYKDGTNWTPGDYASGANASASDEEATKAAAWYAPNSRNGTHAVAQKPEGGNSLGLFDMSGNVSEWCFDIQGIVQHRRGGHWFSDYREVRVGDSSRYHSGGTFNFLGLRIGKTD